MYDIEKKIYDFAHEMFLAQGIDNLTALILSVLWLEPTEISMQKLAKKTGYSLSSISLKMKHIGANWGVKRIKKPESRTTYLYMVKDLLAIWIENIKWGFWLERDMGRKKAIELIEEYGKEASTERQKKIVENIEMYMQRLDDFERILKVVIEEVEKIKREEKEG